MENNLNGIQELTFDSLIQTNGGEVSLKTELIGLAVGLIGGPICGIAFWVGYYVNT